MLPKPLQAIWGDLSSEEIKKFSILASAFSLIISVYWMLKTLKDPIFDLYVGFGYQPLAKLASLIFVGISVVFYSKLIDLFKKQSIFYIMCGLYGLSFLVLAFFLKYPTSIESVKISWMPGNLIGWAAYLLIESLGSIMPALFWGFVASVTTTESAKRGYAMIITCTQVGTIIGPLLISYYSGTHGLSIFFAVSALLIFVVPFIISLYNKVMATEIMLMSTHQSNKATTGLFEGARLLFTRPYLMGIFAIATLYEFVGTILDFQKGMLISTNYPSKIDGGASFAWFKGIEGSLIGVVSLLFAMFGTSFFLRRFGLKFCLMSFPTIIGATVTVVCTLYWVGANQYQLMWVFLGSMIIIKGLNYALNNPTREVLYIPTSKDVKFKTKGWIDAFGARLLKTFGSGVNELLKDSVPLLISIGSLLSLGIIGFWIFAAIFVSEKFDDITSRDKIIE